MRLIITLFSLAVLFFSCNKLEIEKEAPKCIKNEVKAFEKSSTCNEAEVTEHLFHGETLYVFYSGNCGADMGSTVRNIHCEEIGFLGGISGNSEIQGKPFSDATFVRDIWKK